MVTHLVLWFTNRWKRIIMLTGPSVVMVIVWLWNTADKYSVMSDGIRLFDVVQMPYMYNTCPVT